MGEHHAAAVPVALYGINLLMCAIAFTMLLKALLAVDGPETGLAEALGKDWKGTFSLVTYVVAIPLAFLNQWLAIAIYIAMAALWFVPDKRMERAVATRKAS
jgi:uncharacterized membrane protein